MEQNSRHDEVQFFFDKSVVDKPLDAKFIQNNYVPRKITWFFITESDWNTSKSNGFLCDVLFSLTFFFWGIFFSLCISDYTDNRPALFWILLLVSVIFPLLTLGMYWVSYQHSKEMLGRN